MERPGPPTSPLQMDARQRELLASQVININDGSIFYSQKI